MKKEDLGHIQDRIKILEEHYQKSNVGDIILKIANRIEEKRPGLKGNKEVIIERAYALARGLLEKTKGFDTFDWVIPMGMKGPSDWNSKAISDVIAAWKTGSMITREKLVAEGRVMTHDGKVVSKILKYHLDPDGSFIIDEAEYVDYDNDESLPVVRDTKKEFKSGSANFNYGRPLYPRYHIDVYALAGISNGDTETARLVTFRYQGKIADPTSEEYMGDVISGKQFKYYENVKAQMVSEDTYNGNTSIWGEEIDDPDIDLKIAQVLPEVDDKIRSIALADLEEEFNDFFNEGGKPRYDRLGISEVTITRVETDRFGRIVLYLTDPSLEIGEMNIRGYIPSGLTVEFPVLPCLAMITYYIRQRDGVYDPKLRQQVEGKTYELGITGIKPIDSGGLSEEEKLELEDLLED